MSPSCSKIVFSVAVQSGRVLPIKTIWDIVLFGWLDDAIKLGGYLVTYLRPQIPVP